MDTTPNNDSYRQHWIKVINEHTSVEHLKYLLEYRSNPLNKVPTEEWQLEVIRKRIAELES